MSSLPILLRSAMAPGDTAASANTMSTVAPSPEHVQRITIGHVEKADAGRQAAVVIGVARRNVTASHRHGDGGGANIGTNLEDRAAREGFDEKIDKTAIRVSGRATSESAPSPRRDVVIADGAQFLDQPMTVALVEAGDEFSGLHGRFSVADYAITGARHRFIMWSARFSTFNAASLTASLRVGCEWQVRPISSELPPNSITETASAISSEAACCKMCAPRMRSVFGSATNLAIPSGSSFASARPFARN